MLKRPGILLTLASILMMYTPVSFSSGGRDSVFLKGTLLYNLDLFEVYCPYELLTCGDFLYLFDSDRSAINWIGRAGNHRCVYFARMFQSARGYR